MSEQQNEVPVLGIDDVVNLLNMADLATKRGCWQASELSSVGAVYDKVKKFVDYQQALHAAAQAAKNGDVDAKEQASE